MFQAQKALFIYCVSPIHMGAGTAIGLIDNPIQRERHTDYPMMAGSGLKGAVRHWQWAQLDRAERERKENLLNRLFGPESGDNNLYSGAISFGDAQLVAFPVRCTKRAYVYATSPTALARTKRLLQTIGVACDWPIPEVQQRFCRVIESKGPVDNNQPLYLEAFELTAIGSAKLAEIAQFLADKALPKGDAYTFFREKLKTDLVLLPDEDFGYFVKNATVVEPHVCIDNDTGAAKGTGLFYTENLPPESLLLAPLMTTAERSGKGAMSAEDVLAAVLEGGEGLKGLSGQLVQVGGDATTGRGQIVITAVE
ncbi:MAG: type III-B CRISPR module RAMP protein Cmr4 [Candidatus Competibacter sp.]|nr:type III-B CRISPR module RAMP protein Cmr4 [Candidatus Competibacter sp.]